MFYFSSSFDLSLPPIWSHISVFYNDFFPFYFGVFVCVYKWQCIWMGLQTQRDKESERAYHTLTFNITFIFSLSIICITKNYPFHLFFFASLYVLCFVLCLPLIVFLFFTCLQCLFAQFFCFLHPSEFPRSSIIVQNYHFS